MPATVDINSSSPTPPTRILDELPMGGDKLLGPTFKSPPTTKRPQVKKMTPARINLPEKVEGHVIALWMLLITMYIHKSTYIWSIFRKPSSASSRRSSVHRDKLSTCAGCQGSPGHIFPWWGGRQRSWSCRFFWKIEPRQSNEWNQHRRPLPSITDK